VNDETHLAFARGKIVAICEAVLNETMGVIAASRILSRLEVDVSHHRVGHSFDGDHDFLPFVAIDSETDHLPVDRERANWSPEALARKDKDIATAEARCKEYAFEACRKLIERFDIGGT
jgi:hypothetical protein